MIKLEIIFQEGLNEYREDTTLVLCRCELSDVSKIIAEVLTSFSCTDAYEIKISSLSDVEKQHLQTYNLQ